MKHFLLKNKGKLLKLGRVTRIKSLLIKFWSSVENILYDVHIDIQSDFFHVLSTESICKVLVAPSNETEPRIMLLGQKLLTKQLAQMYTILLQALCSVRNFKSCSYYVGQKSLIPLHELVLSHFECHPVVAFSDAT